MGPHLQFDLEAARFLDLLRELGHVDDRVVMQIAERLFDDADPGGVGPQVVTLEQLRRVVAILLFERQPELALEPGRLLEREWKMLFS